MFRQILEAYRTHGVIKASEEKIREMLAHAKAIYTSSSLALLEHKDVNFDLYARDREINLLVVHIRKMIVEHLSISACHNVGGELVFLKVINDIERVGDYAKNLLDLAQLLPEPLTENEYYRSFKDVFKRLGSHFDLAERALFDGSEDDAKEVIEGHLQINQTCEKVLEDLMKDSQIKVPEAIAHALTARYFKRISSHLKNVASTAVNPFSHIGFMSQEKPVEQDKG